MKRMLEQERAAVASEAAWLKERSAHLARAEAALDRAFSALAAA
jgi:hypothetical protein